MAQFIPDNILNIDPYLEPFRKDIELRTRLFNDTRRKLLEGFDSLSDFADCYTYFGIHRTENGWVYREWAPSAEAMFFTGDFNDWDIYACPMTRLENGVFEVCLKGKNAQKIGQKVQAIVIHSGEALRRIPSYATRVVQDPVTYLWCAEIEDTLADFPWRDEGFKPSATPFIYECHIGMAQEEGKVGSYEEFRKNTLPRIKKAGYNTIQIMAKTL